MTLTRAEPDTLERGVLQRVFMRNPRGVHTLSNAIADANDALAATTAEQRPAVGPMVAACFATLEARGTFMRDRRTGERRVIRPPDTG
jgi:hypothetical protein